MRRSARLGNLLQSRRCFRCCFRLGEELQEICLFGDGDLGGGRRSWGPHVGDPIGDGEVGLMADGGNDRDARFEDRFRDDLLIEGPEILDAPSAPPHDQDIGEVYMLKSAIAWAIS